jgi:SNF2 family DNA or RNA helicase
MDRNTASQLTRVELDKHGLKDWGVRISTNINDPFLGLCMYKDKCIIINAHHIDIHPDAEVKDTILHEVAHALTPGNGHNDVWAAKAREIGCTNTLPCSHLDLPPQVIDAIRSGNHIEMTVEETTHVIRRPKYVVTRLQDKCPECGKVAKEKFNIKSIDRDGNEIQLITLECFHIVKKVIPRGTAFDTMVSNDWNPEIKNCKHDWVKNQCSKCKEYKLFNFQIEGAKRAESGLSVQKGFGIFDDMGLGKTVQALAIIKFHKEYSPTLYIVKSAIKFQWFKQIVRWLGPDYLAQVISTSKDFVFPNLKSYIISYDLLRRFPREKITKLGIKTVILDECQQIKNPDSTRTQEVRKIVGSDASIKVIELSGTPWKNRGSEFFPALNMIDPVKFYSYQHYLDTWVDYYYQGNNKKMGGIRNVKKFKEYTDGLLIRREFNEVMDEFPDINRMKLNVQLDELEQTAYDESTSDFVKWYNQHVIDGTEDALNGMEILAKLSRMRHITGLAKIPATLGFVEEFVEDTDKKLVIFVHHKDVGQLMYNSLIERDKEKNPEWYHLAKMLKENSVEVMKFTAELSDEDRFLMQERFNKIPRAVMIASTIACGEGVDLQTCHDSILHERQWNPQNEDQATPGRFRRIGQTSSVINITVPEAEGTVDEHLDGLVEKKRIAFHEAMNKGESPVWSESDFAKDLAALIVKKHKEKNKGKVRPERDVTITQMASLR